MRREIYVTAAVLACILLFPSWASPEVREGGEISGEEAAELIRKGIELHGVKVVGGIDLRGETLKKRVIVKKCYIDGNFLLGPIREGSPVIFEKSVSFISTVITGKTSFAKAQFSGDADFREAQFLGEAHFWQAKFSGNAHFWQAKFSGGAYFLNAQFSRAVYFKEAEFSGNVNFTEAKFSRDAYFARAKFSGIVFFEKAKFSGEAFFMETQFLRGAYFWETKFTREAHFWLARFLGQAHFGKAQFSGDTDFKGARFSGEASFGATIFHGDADFSSPDKWHTKFEDIINLHLANFKQRLVVLNTDFSWINLEGIAVSKDLFVLEWSQIENKVVEPVWEIKGRNCEKVHYKPNTLLHNYTFYCRDTEKVKKQYLFLCNVFKANGQFGDADQAYYKYKKLDGILLKNKLAKSWNWVQDKICGYGTEPWKAIVTGLIIMAAFMFIYLPQNAISCGQEKQRDRKGYKRLLSALYFSVNTFTTVGTGDYYPNGKYRFFSMVEGFLGYIIMALFLVTMTAKIIR